NAIKTFSRGMRMKTALSIALAHDTRLLILDEATAGMDASGREEVIELLEDFTAKGNAILLASHISDDMEKLASKLIFMKDGKIILEENKDNLLNNYGIVEVPQVDFNVPTEMIIASRVRQNKIIALINNYHQIKDAHPLTNIDDATKIIMRGEQ
ncbi:ABC transporter ATP-binding protein, partial [Pseudomonas aeruginosa]|nr:ABC transporter ATP-binding protein [Pseudomonas aeruginosa]